MHPTEYNQIRQVIKEFQGLTVHCIKHLKVRFPCIPHDTLYSILMIECQERMKLVHYKANFLIEKCWGIYNQQLHIGSPPGILIRLSALECISPCLLAKMVIQKYVEQQVALNGSSPDVQTLLRDTSLIKDRDVSYEVFMCNLFDNVFSPNVERLKQSLGQQYEIKLYKQVTKMGLAFRDEDHMRKFGYDKTPDVKLEVPIAIDGRVVNWIESKALFANFDVHREYLRTQYVSYYNRFGPGLVIYWFGFNEDITYVKDIRFLIRDHMPDVITHMV